MSPNRPQIFQILCLHGPSRSCAARTRSCAWAAPLQENGNHIGRNHVGGRQKNSVRSWWCNPYTCTNIPVQPVHLHVLTTTCDGSHKLKPQPSACNTCARTNIPVQPVRAKSASTVSANTVSVALTAAEQPFRFPGGRLAHTSGGWQHATVDAPCRGSVLACLNREDPEGGLAKGGVLIRHLFIVMNMGRSCLNRTYLMCCDCARNIQKLLNPPFSKPPLGSLRLNYVALNMRHKSSPPDETPRCIRGCASPTARSRCS